MADVLKESLEKRPLVLSYSQISTYQQCPLKYKYRYIERRPTKPSPYLAFGNTIHNTLRDFHKDFDPRETVLGDILNLYEKNWLTEGYESKEEETRFRKEGTRILKSYYQTALKNPNLPLHFEEEFKFRIGECEVWGRIDRIDELPDGEWELIDYKTGKRRINEAELEANLDFREIDENFQLSLYYLGCQERFKRAPQKVSLWYLKNNQKLSVTRRVEQLRDVERIIVRVANAVREKKFEPKKGPLCPWCDYKELCPTFEEASSQKR